MTDTLLAFAVFVTFLAAVLALAYGEMDRRRATRYRNSAYEVDHDHAVALDRLETNVEIINRQLGIVIDWDRAADGRVPVSRPPSKFDDAPRMQA